MNRRLLTGTAFGAAVLLCASGSAQAADIPPSGGASPTAAGEPGTSAHADDAVAEIVVTAQKRAERIQDVPISVTVVSQQQLERQQVTTLTDLARTTPALEFSAPGSAPGGGGIVRGVGTVVFSESAEPSVGVVVDGVTQFNANVSNLFDVARVEILEGPQGTLFGQSVSAGVINITTPKPDPTKITAHFASQLSGDGFAGSDYGRQIFQTAINLPLSPDAAIRIAAHEDHLSDVQRNAYLGENDNSNDYGVRARLMWQPTAQIEFDLIGDYNRTTSTEGSALSYRVAPALLAADLSAACGITVSANNFETCGSVPGFSRGTTYGFSGQVTADLGAASLTSITAYRKRTSDSQTDVDGFPSQVVTLPLDIDNGVSTRNSTYITQELRLQSNPGARLEYVIGAFYSHYVSEYVNPLTLTLNFGGPAIVQSYTQIENTRLSSLAGFGQLTFHATGHLRLIAGGRVTRATVRDALIDPSQSPTSGVGSDRVTNFSWKAGAQYDISHRVMAYATISRGFKGPQINDATLSAIQVVQPELPMNYEMGLKTTALHGKLGADLGVFYEKVKNYQAQVCPPGSIRLCTPSNISEVTTKGVEVSAFGKPLTGVTINAGYIFNPTAYPTGYTATDGTDLGGQQLAFTAKHKITFSGEYAHPINDRLDGFLAVDAVYRSAQKLYATTAPEASFPAYWTLGGEFGVRTSRNWKLSVFARNLTNKAVPAIIAPSPFNGLIAGASYQQYFTAASKRAVGLAVTLDY